MTNFPQGITYGRNVDWTAHKLLDVTSNPSSNITTSIDPFFVHYQSMPLYNDFYVRDWTDNPTSGDDGSEPSIKQEFYVTSDVWNRRGTLSGSFPNDQPENEDAGNGTGTIGDNWLFTRIRRRASAPTGSPTVTISAHFLVANFGLGTNFVDSSDSGLPSAGGINIDGPDPTLTFSASEVGPKITDALHWALAATSSTHLCIAVEISSADDPYYNSSLHGRSPGWPNTDLEIVYDNNKAQRNINTTTTRARGVGFLSCPIIQYGIVHNAATYSRDMNIRYRLSPALIKHETRISIRVIGQESIQAKDSGSIVLKNMRPGENRWIEINLGPPKGKNSEIFMVSFEELVGGSAINGFGVGIRLGTEQETFMYTLTRVISVFRRLTVIWKMSSLEKHIQYATKIFDELKSGSHNNYLTEYSEYLLNNHSFIEEMTRLVDDRDPFDIKLEGENISKLLNTQIYDVIFVCLPSYLERIDSYLTMIQLTKGDITDILQTVRWQYDVLRMLKQKSSAIMDIEDYCLQFIKAWEIRTVGIQDYPLLLEKIIPPLVLFANEIDDKNLLASIDRLKEQKDLDLLQGLHRQVLLQIQSTLKKG